MIIGIHQPQYLIWLGLVDRVYRCDKFVLLDNVPYSKNYFYNRNRIKTANGWIWLTIPVVTKNRFGQLIKDVQINNTLDWRKDHWKSISLAYKKCRYFDQYATMFEEIYNQQWQYLGDICEATTKLIMKAFGITTPIYKASELGIEGKKEELLINICKNWKADMYLSGVDGRNYLNSESWRNSQIEVNFQDFKHPKYPQLYGDFIPQMAAIDLLFNCGGESLDILKDEHREKIELILK